MRSKSAIKRVPPPRNSVVLAIVGRLATAASRRHESARRQSRQQANADLAQRVRESGEW